MSLHPPCCPPPSTGCIHASPSNSGFLPCSWEMSATRGPQIFGNLKEQSNTLKFQRVLFLRYLPLAFHRLELGPITMWAQLNHSFHPDYFGYFVVFGSLRWRLCHTSRSKISGSWNGGIFEGHLGMGAGRTLKESQSSVLLLKLWGQTCVWTVHALMLWNQPGGRQHMPVFEPHLPVLLTHSVTPVNQILDLWALFLFCQIFKNNI